MDINSLLSPSDNAASKSNSGTPATETPTLSPFKHAQQRRQSSTPAQALLNTPRSRSIQAASSIPAHVRSPSQQPSNPSPLISPVPTDLASSQLPRLSSTPTMETLADFAANQASKATPPILSRDSSESQKSSGLFPHLTSAGATSNPRASIDIAMVDTPKQVLRSDYTDSSLPLESQQRLAALVSYVHETPSSYDAHIEIIKILHQGLVDHIYPSSNPSARRDPRTYDLLPQLREARENLDKLFAVGEDQWLDWLQDESILAQTADERVAVVDKCRRAVTEEFGSTQLWTAYGEWILHCHKWALDSPGSGPDDKPDTERMVGREVFDWSLVIDTWTEAVEHTKHDLSRSHELWDKYMTVRFGDTSQKLPPKEVDSALELYVARLRVPHVEWQRTFQAFSSFVSANMPAAQYEGIMATNLSDSASSKKIVNDRDRFETALQEARTSGDSSSEYQAFSSYIEWERAEEEKARTKPKGKGKRGEAEVQNTHFDMISALYQRAELRFPAVVAIWEEHVDYLTEKARADLLDVLARATKHCPWSGSLWKQYLLTSELADQPFDETEQIKHKATNTGLLDAAGVEEAVVVYDAWCGFLLRRTKRADATEEDADVAEMGMRSSIEAVHSLASKLGLGPDFDPSFRLQRKYVEYLNSQGRFDNAGAQFHDSITDYGKHYKFWLRFYEFELQKSVQMAFLQRPGPDRLSSLSSAPFAVGVLKQGLQHSELEYPEPLMEALLNHCEDYEDADELQSATTLVRKVQKRLAAKRQQESLQAKEIAMQSENAQEEVAHRTQEVANGLHIGKRKREDGTEEEDNKKRLRADDVAEDSVELTAATEEPLKRDREHASILVQNIPVSVTETKIRQFFSNCGTVKHLKFLQDDVNSVVVEFEDANEASFALSRDGRDFEGSELSVMLNTGSTLFITNYPAAADEPYIRNLFQPYGEIVNVRFPSLQRNKRRRFCYLEFKQPTEAQAATELDNKELEGLQMSVKISEPAARHARAEKKGDDRTIFVGHVSFKATTEELEKFFSKYGTLEHVKLPRDSKAPSRNRGIAFLTFSTAEEAKAALAMNGEEFMGRPLSVSIASEGGAKSQKGVNGRSKSPSTQPEGDTAAAKKPAEHDAAFIEERNQRTIAIGDVPDTVNDSRIKAMAEKIGPVQKVILKTHHQGALIEFKTIPDAGRAMIELDNHEIDPGRRIRVMSEKELYQQQPERKTEQFVKRPSQNQAKPASATGPIKRPAQPGLRKGGHLGQRSNVLFQSQQEKKKSDAAVDDKGEGENGGAKKTNDDFRNLISKT